MTERSALHPGLVVASHGRHCMVETPDGERRICHPRGKKNQVVVGDQVLWQAAPAGQGHEGTIEKVQARRNLFYRQDEIRTKSFAANLDQVLILVAAEPVFSESQLARALIAAEAAGIAPLIALNKTDLVEPFARAWERLLPYRRIEAADGTHPYGVLPLSIVLYILGTPARKRRIKAQQALEQETAAAAVATAATAPALEPGSSGAPPDAGGEPATIAQSGRIAPVREES